VLEYQQFLNHSDSYLTSTKEHDICLIFLFITNHLFLLPFKPSGCQQQIQSALLSIPTMPLPNLARRRCKEAEFQQEAKIVRNGMLRDLISMLPLPPCSQTMLRPRLQKMMRPFHLSPLCITRTRTRTRTKPKPSQHGENKMKAPDLDYVDARASRWKAISAAYSVDSPAAGDYAVKSSAEHRTQPDTTQVRADPPADDSAAKSMAE
jgi:hypothetical protein